jgi:hypothetical protein
MGASRCWRISFASKICTLVKCSFFSLSTEFCLWRRRLEFFDQWTYYKLMGSSNFFNIRGWSKTHCWSEAFFFGGGGCRIGVVIHNPWSSSLLTTTQVPSHCTSSDEDRRCSAGDKYRCSCIICQLLLALGEKNFSGSKSYGIEWHGCTSIPVSWKSTTKGNLFLLRR